MSATGVQTVFDGYESDGYYDELIGPDGAPREAARMLVDRLESLPEDELQRRQTAAEQALLRLGITFTVYGDESGTERIFPVDLVPRIVDGAEWRSVEAGLKQRIVALNLFLDDIYHDQKILAEKVIPEWVIRSADSFRQQCVGLNPPNGVWCHVTGTDLVRDASGTLHVLEDNLRCPSGVSYVLENRELMKRTLPQVFASLQVRPVNDYPERLLATLQSASPTERLSPKVAVLSPGVYNSAYFEHSYLAQQMGVELVEGRDLVVADDCLYMRTTQGFEHIDVLYRRIDDDFLDPRAFRADSMLGVPGLMDLYRRGRIGLANAPGTGIADDKVVYAYVPEIIRYYLGEDPIIPNVPTYVCWLDEQRDHVLQHIDELVVKPANASGGYGMLIGPQATRAQCDEFAERIKAEPRNYIAQPTLNLSRMPTFIDGRMAGRHVDLRPFILYGDDVYVMPGGLTRVALRKGSLVVNSSQGGGSKDTWVLR